MGGLFFWLPASRARRPKIALCQSNNLLSRATAPRLPSPNWGTAFRNSRPTWTRSGAGTFPRQSRICVHRGGTPPGVYRARYSERVANPLRRHRPRVARLTAIRPTGRKPAHLAHRFARKSLLHNVFVPPPPTPAKRAILASPNAHKLLRFSLGTPYGQSLIALPSDGHVTQTMSASPGRGARSAAPQSSARQMPGCHPPAEQCGRGS